uniref:Uncharacterized protein n=1 Tax=viral metagenome TaxID=1070528 RepID=A0A6M3LRP1_9ZZZZ
MNENKTKLEKYIEEFESLATDIQDIELDEEAQLDLFALNSMYKKDIVFHYFIRGIMEHFGKERIYGDVKKFIELCKKVLEERYSSLSLLPKKEERLI